MVCGLLALSIPRRGKLKFVWVEKLQPFLEIFVIGEYFKLLERIVRVENIQPLQPYKPLKLQGLKIFNPYISPQLFYNKPA